MNFYRVDGHGPFKIKDFHDLERLAPIIGRFVLRHARLTRDKSSIESVYEKRITQLIHDNTQVFSQLSTREKEVCIQSLLGYEEKDIAKIMGVSLSTIITHRRRLYGKLNISSKTELFQLAFMAHA